MIQRVSVLLAAVVFSLFLGEVCLQLLYRVRTGDWLWRRNAFQVGYTQPVSDRRKYSLRPGWIDTAAGITINRLGFRGPLVDPKSTRIIVALGDSVPFGAGVGDEDTYPAQLDQRLSQGPGGARVLNAGVPSYNLRQAFDRLRLEVLKYYNVPLAITLQAANDISLLSYYRHAYTPEATWADLRFRDSWTQPALARVATVYYVHRAFAPPPGRPQAEQHSVYPADRMLRNVRAVLDQGLRYCEERSIPVILMPVDPFYYQVKNTGLNRTLSRWSIPSYREYAEMWDNSIRQLNQLLGGAALQYRQVYFFDTRLVMDAQDREDMYIDFLHYSSHGNTIIAKALAKFLSQTVPALRALRWDGEASSASARRR